MEACWLPLSWHWSGQVHRFLLTSCPCSRSCSCLHEADQALHCSELSQLCCEPARRPDCGRLVIRVHIMSGRGDEPQNASKPDFGRKLQGVNDVRCRLW